jgi:hypothetical protein
MLTVTVTQPILLVMAGVAETGLSFLSAAHHPLEES